MKGSFFGQYGARVVRDPHPGNAAGSWRLVFLGPVMLLASACAGADADALGLLRETMDKRVEIYQAISRERREWRENREVLVGRIQLIEEEAAQLEKKITEDLSAAQELENQLEPVLAETKALDAASAFLLEQVRLLEDDLGRRLLKSLPDPLKEKLAPLIQRIPADPANTQLAMAERYQNAIGILNEVNKFNGQVNVVSEIRSMAGGGAKQVKTLYLGIGQAYCVSPKGDLAAVGEPGDGGWTWRDAPVSAAAIKRAIGMLDSKHGGAEFVPLPVKLEAR
ncbi:MAG TPA: DUF3450 family protein [Verrucomicrobiae bacterium]|nr:DUF3450 family protein [Verrucomicrobiae bacterium]